MTVKIDEHVRLDRSGNPHVVRVMRSACGSRIRYVVDGKTAVPADVREADLVVVPGLGKLIRPLVWPSTDQAADDIS